MAYKCNSTKNFLRSWIHGLQVCHGLHVCFVLAKNDFPSSLFFRNLVKILQIPNFLHIFAKLKHAWTHKLKQYCECLLLKVWKLSKHLVFCLNCSWFLRHFFMAYKWNEIFFFLRVDLLTLDHFWIFVV